MQQPSSSLRLAAVAIACAISAGASGTLLAADQVIKIGALLPMSGPGSYFGAQDKQGIELALEQLNKSGVNGFKIEAPHQGSAWRPLPATPAAKRLNEQYKPEVPNGGESLQRSPPTMTIN